MVFLRFETLLLTKEKERNGDILHTAERYYAFSLLIYSKRAKNTGSTVVISFIYAKSTE